LERGSSGSGAHNGRSKRIHVEGRKGGKRVLVEVQGKISEVRVSAGASSSDVREGN
jgi:hypothetical protein